MYRALDAHLDTSHESSKSKPTSGRLRVQRTVGLRGDGRFVLQQALQAAALSPEREAIILVAPHETLIHHAHHLRKLLAQNSAPSRAALFWIPVRSEWDEADSFVPPSRLETASFLGWPHPLFSSSTNETATTSSPATSFCAGLPFALLRPGFSVCVGDSVKTTREAVQMFLDECKSRREGEDFARCWFIMPDLQEWMLVASSDVVLEWVLWIKALTRVHQLPVEGIVSASFTGESSSFIFEYLQSVSDILVDVSALETGYARDVHGQILVTHTTELATTQKVLHYKLGETSSSFFPPGAKDLATIV